MKSTVTMRLWFALMAILLWIGIYLTGFGQVNWLIYLPTVGFTAAALVGYCPSQMALLKLSGKK